MPAGRRAFGVQLTGLAGLFIGMETVVESQLEGTDCRIPGRGAMKTSALPSTIGAMVAAGVALGAVVIGSNAGLRSELRVDIRALERRLSAVERRQAQTEGLLEGLRDAITARSPPAPRGRDGTT